MTVWTVPNHRVRNLYVILNGHDKQPWTRLRHEVGCVHNNGAKMVSGIRNRLTDRLEIFPSM